MEKLKELVSLAARSEFTKIRGTVERRQRVIERIQDEYLQTFTQTFLIKDAEGLLADIAAEGTCRVHFEIKPDEIDEISFCDQLEVLGKFLRAVVADNNTVELYPEGDAGLLSLFAKNITILQEMLPKCKVVYNTTAERQDNMHNSTTYRFVHDEKTVFVTFFADKILVQADLADSDKLVIELVELLQKAGTAKDVIVEVLRSYSGIAQIIAKALQLHDSR